MEVILPLIALVVSINVYIDALAVGVRKGLLPGFFNRGAGTWAMACFLSLIVCLPLYLFKRGAYVQAAAREKEEAVRLAQAQPLAAEPGVSPPLPQVPPGEN